MDMAPLLDLSVAPFNVVTSIFECMSLRERFTCALVCKAWAEAATAAAPSIILRQRVQSFSSFFSLQAWLIKHGTHLKVLQLHDCVSVPLTALPCPQLQDLLLHTFRCDSVGCTVWCDIAAATKLTSVSLSNVFTSFPEADVVSAVTALPDLQQLTWRDVSCSGARGLSDSSLLQQTTLLTYLGLHGVSSAALQHLSSLTKLQHLSVTPDGDWVAADCPGLQELKALTGLHLSNTVDLPASVSQLTALQQLEVWTATPAAAHGLQVLASLTKLKVRQLKPLADQSLQMQITSLELAAFGWLSPLPMSYVSSCKQLRIFSLQGFSLVGAGSLVASTMLQHLELNECMITAADGDAAPVSWQQVFPAQVHLPHLTSLQLSRCGPRLQHSDIDRIVAAGCSSLQVLHLGTLQDSFAPVLARLPALTSLHLDHVTDALCRPLAQLTGLREVVVGFSAHLTRVGLQQLAALEQLTSLGLSQGCSRVKVSPILLEVMLDELPGCSHAIVNKAPAGCPSDVPSRLLRACDAAAAAGQGRSQASLST